MGFVWVEVNGGGEREFGGYGGGPVIVVVEEGLREWRRPEGWIFVFFLPNIFVFGF